MQAIPPFFWPDGSADTPSSPPRMGSPLGHDEQTWICVDGTGQVWSDDPTSEHPTRYVNNSREAFEKSLEKLAEAWAVRADLEDDAALKQASSLRIELTTIDASADQPGSWWGAILEEFDADLL